MCVILRWILTFCHLFEHPYASTSQLSHCRPTFSHEPTSFTVFSLFLKLPSLFFLSLFCRSLWRSSTAVLHQSVNLSPLSSHGRTISPFSHILSLQLDITDHPLYILLSWCFSSLSRSFQPVTFFFQTKRKKKSLFHCSSHLSAATVSTPFPSIRFLLSLCLWPLR